MMKNNNRLTSTERLSEEQLAGFIARQLVETAQGAKGIAELMKAMLPGTDIVYAKARNVSDFRKEYKMLKSRLVNDYHHAQDAYLNIVVGNVYFTKFTRNPMNFIKKEARRDGRNYDYNLYKMYSKDIIRNGRKSLDRNKRTGTGNDSSGKGNDREKIRRSLQDRHLNRGENCLIFSRLESILLRRIIMFQLKINDEKCRE